MEASKSFKSKKGPGRATVVSARKHGRAMSFNPVDYEEEYRKKLTVFLDFLFKVNFANGVYLDLGLLPVEEPVRKYRVYIGRDNNHQLVR